MTSIILIGFLVKENETEYINLLKTSNIIENILEYIKKIRNGEYDTNSGFDLWELLLGLEALSSIENIKKNFFKTDNVMSTLISIMSSASTKSKEINVILLIIQNLINDDDIREIIKNKYNIGKVIKRFKDCGTDLIEGLVKNILNKLETQNKQVENKYDIFVSFTDADKDTMLKVEYFLKQCYTVYNRNENSTALECINQSKIIVAGLSDSYSNDESCKSCLIWAFNNDKCIIPLLINKLNPYSWLKNILKNIKGIDFSDDSTFRNSFLTLCKVIQSKGYDLITNPNNLQFNNYKVQNVMARNIGSVQSNTRSSSILQFEDKIKYREIKKIIYSGSLEKCNEKGKEEILDNQISKDLKNLKLSQTKSVADPFTQWTKNDVSEWLTKSNLSKIHNKFNEFDGEMIKSLLRLKKTEAATYYRQLEDSLGLSFKEILKLDSALSKLEE